MAYEKKLGKYLEKLVGAGIFEGKFFAKHWFQFCDANGPGWAQPDFFIVQPQQVLVFEAKLTQTPAAEEQLELLYRPLIEHTFKRPAVSIQVCKNLVQDCEGLVRDFASLKDGSTLHWLGV